jgi:hypothetical protein
VDGAELFLLGMFLGAVVGWLNKCLCERRGELEVGLFEGDEDGEEVGESSLYLMNDAGLSVTQSDDPLSGGHFVLGVSKAPLNSGLSGGSKN